MSASAIEPDLGSDRPASHLTTAEQRARWAPRCTPWSALASPFGLDCGAPDGSVVVDGAHPSAPTGAPPEADDEVERGHEG